MFQKILLPYDGSRCSTEAAQVAGKLSAHHGGVVCPLVAVEFQYVIGDDVPTDVSDAICERIRYRATLALTDAERIVREAGGRTDGGAVVEGVPHQAILQTAEAGEFDLIVMGSRGVSLDQGIERLVGSVAERVLNQTPCPVLIIRAEPRP